MKNNMNRFLLFALTITCLTFQTKAQNAVQASGNETRLSLQDAVNIALKNNISVKQSENQVLLNSLQLQQSKFNQLPNASGNINESFNFGRSLDPFTNTFVDRNINYNQLSLGGNVTIFNGYQLKNTIAQNDLLLKATQFDLLAMKENISLQVVLAYLNIMNAEDQLAIAQTQTGITKLQIDRTDKLVKAGSLPQSNLFDLKAQLATEETTVINNQSTLDLAKLSLLQLLNDKNIADVKVDRISVPTPSTAGYDATISKIYEIAQESQPTIKAADVRIQGADKGIEIAKAGFLPIITGNVNLGANQSNAQKDYTFKSVTSDQNLGVVKFQGQDIPLIVTTTNNVPIDNGTTGYFKQLGNTFNYGFGVNANIPIFSKFANRSNVSRAKIQKENANLNAQQARLTLRQNIEQAYTNLNNSAKRFDALTIQVSALEESFRAAESRFNAGAIDFVNYSLQKTNLDKAKANLVQAKYDFIFRTKILDYYQNKPLTF
ncbi:outer membrane protein [Arcicella aurantiaca]|uniref:Outer membrane protein n=2 Tax=Arcicella aurantiaca TaxID=591202 RepID=A0A316DXR5_9BACT|nr:outer membrane protein [Arcicella aurantiaca]